MQTHTLLFKNPVLKPGLNVTVRNGKKWLKAEQGDELSIRDTFDDKEEIAVGHVVLAELSNLNDIPEWLLQHEHDPSCTTVNGLKQAMDTAYPQGWDENELVVLSFVV